ncbi:MAG: hypothetical protein KDD47_08090, partial [Acidobacteria bacterium]|nr:hypothetical protein [Acidobacteriota bacterium]
DRYQRTFAHELGHLFGLFHNSRDLAPDTGWDVENLLGLGKVMPGTKFDIMRGGLLTPEAWVDDITYEFFLDSECVDCTGDTGDFISEAPWVTLAFPRFGGETILNPVFQFPRFVRATPSLPGAQVFVRALGRSGEVLEEIGVIPNFETEAGAPLQSAAVSVTFSSLIDVGSIESIQVVAGGKVRAARQRSPNPPEVTVLSPRPGQTLSGPFEVTWQSRDRDGDPLTYIVQYSSGYDSQGRQRWVPLATGLRENRLVSDTRYLAGTANGTLRVVASDGLNTTLAAVDGLFVPGEKPPQVTIAEPGEAGEFLEGSLVTFQASAYDWETGILPDDQILWTSDVDGMLGSGATLQTGDLSPGLHRITVSAKDEAGGRASDQIEVRIRSNPLAGALQAARLKLAGN